jgi:hypothetical protein
MCLMSGREATGDMFREFSDAMEVKVKNSGSPLTVTRPHRSYSHAGGEFLCRYRFLHAIVTKSGLLASYKTMSRTYLKIQAIGLLAEGTIVHADHLLPYAGNLHGSMGKKQKHTTGGIPRWSPTLVLVARFSAYVWQSGRDAQFSLTYGRMYKPDLWFILYRGRNAAVLLWSQQCAWFRVPRSPGYPEEAMTGICAVSSLAVFRVQLP